jgi:hypothetical protein
VTPQPHGPAPAVAATAAGPWPGAYQHKTCTCGHGIGEHAIRANKTRGACSRSTGPKATPCPCKSYEEAT